jgi:hypothetical protein
MLQPSVAVGPHRNIGVENLAATLKDQSTRAVDVIAGAAAIRCVDGNLVLNGTEPTIGPDGVTMTAGTYAMNDNALNNIGDKLSIPIPYLRRMAADNVPLLDANVNSWLERDHRRFLIRCLRRDNGPGIARAFLSDRYARIDNLDVLLAALDGIRKAGVNTTIADCDLTDRRMYLRVVSPDVQVAAPQLLKNYRSPFDGRRGSDLPIVSGGFLITNSETGCGRFGIAPWLRVEVCGNGMTVERSAMLRTHLGAKITDDDGVLEPSPETVQHTLNLIMSQTTDAVRAFLDIDFVTRAVRDIEKAAGVGVDEPDATIKVVGQRLRYTDEQQQSILAHFIRGGDLTVGGIMQAVTSVARTVADADAAYRLESTAVQALQVAATA